MGDVMTFRLSLVGLAVASVLPAPAFAASSSSANIGPLTVMLFDLDPLDNVAPSITFNDLGYNYVYADAYQDPFGAYQENYSVGPWTPNAAGASAGVAQASASIIGPAVANGTMISASGSVADFHSPNNGEYAEYYAHAYAPADQYFTLSANTVVVISGAAHVAVTGTGTSSYDSAEAGAYISIYGPGGGGGGSQSADDSISLSISDAGPFSYIDSRSLGVSFVNLTGADMTGNLLVQAYVYGETYSYPANPVPEPENWAMMLVGLLTLGSLARHRRRRD